MRKVFFVLVGATLIAAVLLMLVGCSKPKPSNEIPITTVSDEGRQLFVKARDMSENLRTEEAVKLIDEAIRKDPDFALAYALKGATTGDFAKALEFTQKAKSLIGKVSPGERLLILYFAAGQEYNPGVQKSLLDSLLKLFPADKRAVNAMGDWYSTHGDNTLALEYFRKVTVIDSAFAPTYNSIGYACMNTGDYTGAESAFKKYIRLVPDQPNPYDSYAEFLMKRGRFDESIEQYKKAMEKSSAFTSSLLGIGHNYVFKGEYAKGREYYDKYAENAPDHSYDLARLGWVGVSYVHEGKIPDAMTAFQKQREVAEKEKNLPATIFAAHRGGLVQLALGKPSLGLERLQECAKLAASPDLSPTMRASYGLLTNLWLGYAYLRTNMTAQAEKVANECRKEAELTGNIDVKSGTDALMTLLTVKKGEYDKGLEMCSKLSADVNQPYIEWMAYTGKGDKEKANSAKEKLMNWNSNSLGFAILRKMAESGTRW